MGVHHFGTAMLLDIKIFKIFKFEILEIFNILNIFIFRLEHYKKCITVLETCFHLNTEIGIWKVTCTNQRFRLNSCFQPYLDKYPTPHPTIPIISVHVLRDFSDWMIQIQVFR